MRSRTSKPLDPLQVFRGLNDNAVGCSRSIRCRVLVSPALGVLWKGRWHQERPVVFSPRFNRTSAYRSAKTDSFGAIGPMIPSLIRVLVDYQTDLPLSRPPSSAGGAEPPVFVQKNTLVYLDPPYAETTPLSGWRHV